MINDDIFYRCRSKKYTENNECTCTKTGTSGQPLTGFLKLSIILICIFIKHTTFVDFLFQNK